MTGLLIFNKPLGVTSRTVVDRVETWFPDVRVGHAGTLDPLATGVLVLCLGRATRLIEYIQDLAKTYVAGIRLGARSATDDAEGPIEPVHDPVIPTEQMVRECLQSFVGEIDQVPPAYSAAHSGGRRAYKLARAGRAVSLPPRRVRIDRITLDHFAFPDLSITVECGKGVYIRSLARDLGERLGCGGYVNALERTRIGPFTIENALATDASPAEAVRRLLPMKAAIAQLPVVTLSAADLLRLRQGQRLPLALEIPTGDVAVIDAAGDLAAIAFHDAGPRILVPKKVL